MTKEFFKQIDDHMDAFEKLKGSDGSISNIISACVESFNKKGKLIFCGNGGSASDAQHLAAEFTGRFSKNRKALPAISLAADSSAITCIGNDFGFENIFSRQLEALASETDIVFLISTSGMSPNIINAAKYAKKINVLTVGFLGKDGGEVKDLVDMPIIVESNNTARIQEAHIFLGQYIVGEVEKGLGI